MQVRNKLSLSLSVYSWVCCRCEINSLSLSVYSWVSCRCEINSRGFCVRSLRGFCVSDMNLLFRLHSQANVRPGFLSTRVFVSDPFAVFVSLTWICCSGSTAKQMYVQAFLARELKFLNEQHHFHHCQKELQPILQHVQTDPCFPSTTAYWMPMIGNLIH